jgi:hypothetical protein
MTDNTNAFLDSLKKRHATSAKLFSDSKKRKANRMELDKQQESQQRTHSMTARATNSSNTPMDIDSPSFELPELDFASLYNDQDMLDIQKLLSGEVSSDAEDDEVENLPENVPSDSEVEEEDFQLDQSHETQFEATRESTATDDESKFV